MTKRSTNLFDELSGFWGEFDGIFDIKNTPKYNYWWEGPTVPSSNTYNGEDHDDRLELSLDMPGVKKEDIEISFESKVLYVKAERGNRKYDQKFRIKQEVDGDKITAKLEDGILIVTIPKTKESTTTKIKVE